MKRLEVAAAVIERPDGSYLLGQRAPGTFYPGYWEFPGGKLEAGETARAAIIRELHEELGITVHRADPWLSRTHVYEHAHVRLHFFRVREWSGEVRDHVHAAFSWQKPGEEQVTPMLPANGPLFAALAMPAHYAITQAATIGVRAQLTALTTALQQGLRLVQLREPHLPAADRADFYRQALALCHAAGARALVHADVDLAQALQADGVHLPAAQWQTLSVRPPLPLVAASCHNATELAQAAQLGCDFAVLGPVKPTLTHPEQAGMGWTEFARHTTNTPYPADDAQTSAVPPLLTFALGGLSAADLDDARRAGAHGVAGIRGFWP